MPKKKLKKLTGKEDTLDDQDDKVGTVVLLFFLNHISTFKGRV